jgi:hypothetical protein
MLNSIVEQSPARDHLSDLLEEAMSERQFFFNASSLRNIGFNSPVEIAEAVERAISVCNCSGLSANEHFKAVYLSDNDSHTLCKDWRLSRFGYTLVMLNGSCENPVVGRLQIEMLKKYLQHAYDQT